MGSAAKASEKCVVATALEEKASALEALSISEEERQVHKSCARWCDGGCGRSHRAGTEGRPIPLGNGGMAIGQLTPKISRHLSGGG